MTASSDTTADQQAVSRLFELVCTGHTDALEFSQLDSFVYARLLATYAGGERHDTEGAIA